MPVKTAAMPKQKLLLLNQPHELPASDLIHSLKQKYLYQDVALNAAASRKIFKVQPDIILFYLRHYATDCIQFCKKLRDDVRTMHVPIFILDELADTQHHIDYLKAGATDYIGRPFSNETLLFKIDNQVSQQLALKSLLERKVDYKRADTELKSGNKAFINQAMQVVESNMENPDFNVTTLSKQLFMSRVAMYKKIVMLTGKSPTDFIRSIKMQKAAQLLRESDLTIAEIAYETGYNNPKIFSKLFKKEFNTIPSAFISKINKRVAV